MSQWDDLLQEPSQLGLLRLHEAETRLKQAAKQLDASTVNLGHSRAGAPIELLRIGAGSQRSFWYAGPHANEPVGVSTIIDLAERIAAHPEVLAGDVGFDLLLCIDPDSYLLNESWFSAPIDIATYYRDFFRPASDEWPDWDLPVEHVSATGELHRPSTMPEAKALQAGLELSRPVTLNALHNAELGGAHFYVVGDRGGLAERLSSLPGRFAVPRDEAPLDDPSLEPLAPGVFPLPRLEELWESVLASGASHPERLLPFGGSAAGWCTRFGTLSLVAEVPYWSVVPDPTRPRASESELAQAAGRHLTEFATWLSDMLDTYAEFLSDSDPRVRATRDAPSMLLRLAEGMTMWADSDAARRRATPEAFARYETMLGICLPQRSRGMLLSALEAGSAPHEALTAARDAFDTGLTALSATLLTAHAISTLVDVQLTAGLLATDCAVSSG